MKRLISAVIVAATTLVFAQKQEDPKAAPSSEYARAQQVETMEGDLLSAVDLYARAADNESLDDSTRTQARYRMGLIYRRLGREHDARKALESAARGKGFAAGQAKEILAGKEPQDEKDWSVHGRIARSISKLYDPDSQSEGIEELVLIGEAAVQPLAQAIRNDKSDISFVGNGVSALIGIGGTRVAEWLARVAADKDVYYRRAVISSAAAVRKKHHRRMQTSAMLDQLRKFILDSDPHTSRNALSLMAGLRAKLSEKEYLAVLKRRDATVLDQFFRSAVGLGIRDLIASDPGVMKRLDEPLKACFHRSPVEVQNGVLNFLRNVSFHGPDAVRTWLDLLVSVEGPIAQDRVWSSGLNSGFNSNKKNPGGDSLSAAEFLAWARRTPEGFFEGMHSGDPQQVYDQFPRQIGFVQTVSAAVERWTRKDVPAMVELQKMGAFDPSRKLEKRIRKVATAQQLPMLVNSIRSFDQPYMVTELLLKNNANPAFVAPLVGWIDDYLKTEPTDGELQVGPFPQVLQSLAHQKTPEALRYITEIGMKSGALYRQSCQALAQPQRAKDGSTLPYLKELLTFEGDGDLAAVGRFDAWIPVYRVAAASDVELLFAAGKKGLLSSGTYKSGTRTMKMSSLWRDEPGGAVPLRCSSTLSGAERARVLAGVMEGSGASLGESLNRALQPKGSKYRNRTDYALLPEVLLLAAGQVFTLEGAIQADVLKSVLELGVEKVAGGESFILRALNELDREGKIEVLNRLQSPADQMVRETLKELLAGSDIRLTCEVLDFLSRHGDTSWSKDIRALLPRTDSSIRAGCIRALIRIEREDAVEAILPLAADPNSFVRRLLCEKLAEVPKREIIPVLVEALRDTDQQVRKAAEASLKRVQYYFEQKDNWDRFLSGAGLDAPTAVEALLQQAAAENPTETRVLAIESLGTLGVPETLPILITFVSSDDKKVAEAAKKAISKINNKVSTLNAPKK